MVLQFHQKSYKRYVHVVSDVKEKCGANGGGVASWNAFLGGGHTQMFFLITYLSKNSLTPFHSHQILHNEKWN
jgi:hypothetical protein